MEIKTIESELKPLEKEIVSFQQKAESIEITNDDDYSFATDFVGVINEKKKSIENARKFFVDPLNKQVKDINAMFKPQVEQADEIITLVKKKMGAFWQAKENARLKEEKRLQDIRDKANAKREEQGKEAIIEPIKQVAEVAKTVMGNETKSTVRKVWKHKLISMGELPSDVQKAIMAEAWKKGIVDTVIRNFIKAGIREMKGVEIFEEAEISLRS